MSFYPVTAAAVQLMTFSYLHLKLPWSGGIYPNPTVKQSPRNTHANTRLHTHTRMHGCTHTHTCTNSGKETEQGKMRERREQERERERERARERERREVAEERRDWHCLSVRCPELRCTRCHPHDRAVCRGHLPHYGKCMHLGQALAGSSSAWAEGKWHTGNYYCIMLASCTHCMHTYCTEGEREREREGEPRAFYWMGMENFVT